MTLITVRVYDDVTVGGGLDLSQGIHDVNLNNLASYQTPIENGLMGFALSTKQTDLLAQEVNEQIYKLWINDKAIIDSIPTIPLTTKGDILGFSTAVVRIPVGADDLYLKADSTASRGVSYANPLTVGKNITSGTNNRILFQSSGTLAQSANFTYDGSTLKVQAVNSSQTANIFEAVRYDGAVALRVDDDSSITLGASYDYANAKHAPQHIFQYVSGGGYSGKGIKIADVGSGSIVRLHTISNSLFLTDDSGTAASMLLGTRVNPADTSTFIAQSGFWWINSGVFSVGTSSLQGNAQIESFSTSKPQFAGYYDASNYLKITIASDGATTLDAVGSGAKLVMSDKLTARIEKRLRTQENQSTLTPNANSYDVELLTSQSSALVMATPSGTPTDDQDLIVRIICSSNNSISWTGNYTSTVANTLPPNLISGSTLRMHFIYDASLDTWVLVNLQEY
jgi:hypothetical protein